MCSKNTLGAAECLASLLLCVCDAIYGENRGIREHIRYTVYSVVHVEIVGYCL
jgi:hypothetical protein